MANYECCERTNYFRVTDEKRYNELFSNLVGMDLEDFTEEKDDVIYHGFGAYDSIDFGCNDEDYDFGVFLTELQKILPENEAFIYFESGHEKMRYITGFALVCTHTSISYMNIVDWAKQEAKRLISPEYETQTEY